MAQTCVEIPPKCKTPGSPEWLKEVNKARDFTSGQRVQYAARQEVAVEFGIDDVIRRRDIDELPDVLTDGEGEDAPLPPNYNLEEFKFLLEQSKIDIRRDRLTTLNSFIAAIQERSDSQATLVAKLLQRVEPEASITAATFETMTAEDLVGLVEAEPKGLHIDPVASGTAAEGEDAAHSPLMRYWPRSAKSLATAGSRTTASKRKITAVFLFTVGPQRNVRST
ncbi:MAG: hypothetical protein HYV60_17715 [Planctomycetia bacterium]|nr:hypothetical protein [Planctomycetia bacterium]